MTSGVRVRLHTLMAGPGGVFEPGREITVSAATAADLVGGGFAERLDPPAPAEARAPAPPEHAAPRARPRSS